MHDISSPRDQIQPYPYNIPPGVTAAALCLESWDPSEHATGIPSEYLTGDIDFPEWALWDDGNDWAAETARSWAGNGATPPPAASAQEAPPAADPPPIFSAAGLTKWREAKADGTIDRLLSAATAPETFGLELGPRRIVNTKYGRRTVRSGAPTKAFEDAWRARGKIPGYTFKPNKKTGKMEVSFWQDLPEERISTEPPIVTTAAAKPNANVAPVAAPTKSGLALPRSSEPLLVRASERLRRLATGWDCPGSSIESGATRNRGTSTRGSSRGPPRIRRRLGHKGT
jgi:hypothetical protein